MTESMSALTTLISKDGPMSERLHASTSSFACPQCRKLNPKSHKIYLNLEKPKTEEDVEQLKAQLMLAELKLEEMNKNVQAEEKSSNLSCQRISEVLSSPFELKGIIMKGVSKSDIKTPLIETILMFANIMKVPCEHSDIETVFIFDRKFFLRTQNYNKVNIVVKFKTHKMKDMFLSNKKILSPRGIIFNEFVDQDTNALFEYAKSLLSANYKHIFCRHNSIFAQKDDGDISHHISNKNDVDMLMSL
ncbi:PREDICTED: uncharacterized protein LOC108970885 isoform X2 [Bactrocera latifrons]|uniref:uncharacterized protein LOC108970885 isoform X2 n=1 Tax=Bactrocera latifrons TaxID=174628 RepID=UPI0008DE7996|nr:PREDICTED: uncharacterized protein LOC108970885 isoform X2 [Bactrocera latifrons]XP_018792123.1 PREDICTED: uncharacterized protein LOC108970885 isoform X2 [Bactrocera latifrons]